MRLSTSPEKLEIRKLELNWTELSNSTDTSIYWLKTSFDSNTLKIKRGVSSLENLGASACVFLIFQNLVNVIKIAKSICIDNF